MEIKRQMIVDNLKVMNTKVSDVLQAIEKVQATKGDVTNKKTGLFTANLNKPPKDLIAATKPECSYRSSIDSSDSEYTRKKKRKRARREKRRQAAEPGMPITKAPDTVSLEALPSQA